MFCFSTAWLTLVNSFNFLYRNYSPINLSCILLIKNNNTVKKTVFHNSKDRELQLSQGMWKFMSFDWLSKQK